MRIKTVQLCELNRCLPNQKSGNQDFIKTKVNLAFIEHGIFQLQNFEFFFWNSIFSADIQQKKGNVREWVHNGTNSNQKSCADTMSMLRNGSSISSLLWLLTQMLFVFVWWSEDLWASQTCLLFCSLCSDDVLMID